MAKTYEVIWQTLKATFLGLIPKEENGGSFYRYRPISLCNSSYKIMAKLLANSNQTITSKINFSNLRRLRERMTIQAQGALHSS